MILLKLHSWLQVEKQNSVSCYNMSNVLLFTSWLPELLPPKPRDTASHDLGNSHRSLTNRPSMVRCLLLPDAALSLNWDTSPLSLAQGVYVGLYGNEMKTP